ncbi:HAD family hydrolase [Bacillus sp. MYb56]|uniref:HAD family hydrolase n=1 Tax=Bacillus sp. MYb56 TaxID=1827287 RepID=UPI000CFDAFBF|nr:HAD family hydrolase [Bacillus sp. MYb56]PRD10292.1 HAD family hydrolase [Bacillus sp. MYb56]
MIKMFVSDIDGTMMQHGGLIDEQDVAALRSLAEQNVILCFASGRLDNEIADLMKAVNTNFHRISVNGVFVSTNENKQLLSANFDSSILPDLLAMTNQDPYFRYVSDEHNYYIEEKTPFIHELEKQVAMTSVEEPNLLQKIDDTIFPNKISIGGTKENLQLLQKKIDEKFHGKVSTFISAEQCLDVMPPNISKGSAISVLLQEFQIQPEEVACIGDSYNDIPMFSLTPHSFAMSQADDAVKEHAHYVVDAVKDAVNQVLVYNEEANKNTTRSL